MRLARRQAARYRDGPGDLSSRRARTPRWPRRAAYGGVNILVNNASAIRFGPITELSAADWSFTIRNELDIVFYVTRAGVATPGGPGSIARGTGSIVNIASITATRGAYFMPQNAHGAAKGGVLALTYQLGHGGRPARHPGQRGKPGHDGDPADRAAAG